MKSAKVIRAFPPAPPRRERNELAFLPAALEIVETPPSPVGRAIAATLILLFCLALAWGAYGTIDIVAAAQGKIIPSSRTKVIQALEIGVVRAIHVHDGQDVKAGDVLLEIDPTINEAEGRAVKSELVAAQLDIARLQAALTEDGDPLAAFDPPADAGADLVAMQRQFLTSQVAEARAKVAALNRQREQKQAEAATISATIAKLEAVIDVIQQRYEIRRTLHNAELGSKLQYLEMLQSLTEQQHELLVQKAQRHVTEAVVASIAETITQTKAEFRRTVLEEMAKATQKASGLAESLVKANQRTALQLLKSPVDGTVQQLAVHTTGGVVTPAQELLVVVPADSRLEVEAMVPNRDIGFVHAGQDAEIKVDTFSFTKYGLLRGHVLSISQDAITRQNPQDKAADKARGAEATSSEPRGQELVYSTRVALERTEMQVEGKTVRLAPGMAVTVEIKTGTRTILSYLLSPIVKFRQESFRER